MAARRDRGAAPSGPHRHHDDGRPLAAFAGQVAVQCPRCQAPGWVLAHWKPYRWQAQFRCGRCAYRHADDAWAGARLYSGHRACGGCGHKWVAACRRCDPAPAVAPTTLEGRCRRCGWRGPVPVEGRPLHDAAAVDPHFGLALALQAGTRAGVVWAYNAEHLQTLAEFAAAPLRERGPCFNRSLFSRLPAWMKRARHRVLLQRTVARLQQRLSALPAIAPMPEALPERAGPD